MKEAAVHLVQRLLSLRENKGFGSGEAPRRGSPTSDSGGAELRRFGRGASLPANPYSFVHKHHVSRAQSAGGVPDVVPRSPQTLVLSSTSTTSLGPKAPAAYRTWCLTPRKPLFFRPQAPRLSGPMGLRRHGRGASLPANPCSFVHKHHVSRTQSAGSVPDVVPHSPQTLILSPTSTTSLGSKTPAAYLTWCLTPRNPLFFRPKAPRLSGPKRRRRTGRGASLPAIPCSFVSFAPSLWSFSELQPFGLGTKTPAKPYFSVSFAPSLWPFSELQPFGLGAKTPAKPYSSVSFAPSFWPFSELQPLELGAKTPAKPCSFVSFAPSLWPFSELQPLGLGAKIPAKPCSFVSLAPSPQPKMNLRRY